MPRKSGIIAPVRLGSRWDLLAAAIPFVRGIVGLRGVRSVSVLGSITTGKPAPEDIDVLVQIGEQTDVAVLATHARRLQRARATTQSRR